MNPRELLEAKLNYPKAYRKTRLEVANWVLDHPETMKDLLDFCFQKEKELAYRSTWVLEFVCLEKLELLYPHFDVFFTEIPNVATQQAMRPVSKICRMIAVRYYKERDKTIISKLKKTHKDGMVQCSFDWLLGDNKVASKAYGMTALYYLGIEFDWIHPELKLIIERDAYSQSAGYKATARKILDKIKKFQKLKA